MKSIILLTGLAGSGKSTIAEYIVKTYGYKEFTLAEKLKELTFKILQVFGIQIESINDLYDVNKKSAYRHYIQQIGTECMRATFGNDFWCKQVDEMIKDEQFIIISDVRFLNEEQYFKSRYNVITVKIIRDGIQTMNHQSEQEIDSIKYNYIVRNNGSIEALHKTVDTLMAVINPHAQKSAN